MSQNRDRARAGFRQRPFLISLAVASLLLGLPLAGFAAWLGVQAALAGTPATLRANACPVPPSNAALREEALLLRRRLAELEGEIAQRRAWCPLCAAVEEVDVAVVVDTSISMRFPANMDAAAEEALMRRIVAEAGPLDQPAGRQRLLAALNAAPPDQQRMEQARQAALAAVQTMPARARVQLFSYASVNPANPAVGTCAVTPVGSYENATRARLTAALRGLRPDAQGTPLALSIERASAAVRNRPEGAPGMVVIITDGLETCRGDPCAAVRAARTADPGLQISVVDIAANQQLACLTETTGGRVFSPAAGGDIGRAMAEILRVPPPRACIPRPA
ncbi:vWA domain-containing protein [Roseomonas sp. F4]